MTTRTTHTIWVCVDCLMMAANGECGENPDRTPLGLLDGVEATLGLMADEHHEDCDYRNSMAAKEAAETYNVDVEENQEIFDCNIDCENDEFSWSQCEGCGSTLGGSRHAMTVWEEE